MGYDDCIKKSKIKSFSRGPALTEEFLKISKNTVLPK